MAKVVFVSAISVHSVQISDCRCGVWGGLCGGVFDSSALRLEAAIGELTTT